MSFIEKSKLPRLAAEWYRGRAVVFWTHTMAGRATGWLDERFHAHFREVMIHACGRYRLACPAYVLMPDHWHVVWMGLAEECDQLAATRFLRKHLARELAEMKLQDRAHDRVLRDEERKQGAFVTACAYVREKSGAGGTREGVERVGIWRSDCARISGVRAAEGRILEGFLEDL